MCSLSGQQIHKEFNKQSCREHCLSSLPFNSGLLSNGYCKIGNIYIPQGTAASALGQDLGSNGTVMYKGSVVWKAHLKPVNPTAVTKYQCETVCPHLQWSLLVPFMPAQQKLFRIVLTYQSGKSRKAYRLYSSSTLFYS